MKCGYLLLLVAGCGFRSVSNSPDAAPPVPDGGVAGMWTFDSAADFGAAGHAVQDMTIESRGSLTPNAYTYGGLVAHGLQGMALWQHGMTDWTKLATVTPSGAGFWHGERLSSTSGFNNNLNFLGITNPSSMTIWFEGEVWLEANSMAMFQLNGDDVAFFQIAAPGTTVYGAVSDNNNSAVPVATPTTGWYPIRIGHTNGTGGNNIDFTHGERGGPLIPWTRDRLRARTSELSGMLRTIYGRQILGGGLGAALPVSHFDQSDLLTQTTFSPTPQGAASMDWSARYLGQVYISQPGAYLLMITSDDGSRGRLGTGRGETHWGRDNGTSPTTYTTQAATLAAGWNDVIVDYNQVGGGAQLGVQISGPDFAPAVTVPPDRLRPVEPADDRLVVVSDTNGHSIKDGGGPGNDATATMLVGGYTGETVTSIDLTYEITTGHWNELKGELETPAGMRFTILTPGGGDGDGIAQLTISSAGPAGLSGLLGGPANGAWRLHVYDVVPMGGDSLLTAAKLALHTTGGPDKVARTASWTSQVLDAQTNVIAIDGVTWTARLPAAGAGLQVRVGTCQQANCSDVTWSSPVSPSTAFAIGPARYLQLRVDMTSDGNLEPELQALSVMYRRNSM